MSTADKCHGRRCRESSLPDVWQAASRYVSEACQTGSVCSRRRTPASQGRAPLWRVNRQLDVGVQAAGMSGRAERGCRNGLLWQAWPPERGAVCTEPSVHRVHKSVEAAGCKSCDSERSGYRNFGG